jgi:hypothetical protein
VPEKRIEKVEMKCVFVAKWNCPVDTLEIPLEVCKVCLEARKIQSRNTKFRRFIKSDGVLSTHEVESADEDIEVRQVLTKNT